MRRLIPLLIAFAGIADVGSRFLPTPWFAIRLEEPSRRYPYGVAGHTPGFHYDMSRAYGDLAVFTGTDVWRSYRREWMRVNHEGFRLDGAPIIPGKPPEFLLFGDSFAAGVALSDDATLPAQFYRLTGRAMVNGSVKLDWGHVRRVVNYLGMTKGTIVVAVMDRSELTDATSFQDVATRPDNAWDRFHRVAQKFWDGFWEISPLKILSERVIRRLQNDRLLPNPLLTTATVTTLLNGQTMLFFDQDVSNLGKAPVVDTRGLLLFQDRLRRCGLDLFVLLIPDKYQVYHRLLTTPPPEPTGPSRISYFEAGLRKVGIKVFSLEHVFLSAAEPSLKKGELLYWPDDTHWSPAGTRLAAEALAKALR